MDLRRAIWLAYDALPPFCLVVADLVVMGTHGGSEADRLNNHCEVYPERYCIWTDAYKRSLKMPIYGQGILDVQPPVDWRLEGTSAWMNLLVVGNGRRKNGRA